MAKKKKLRTAPETDKPEVIERQQATEQQSSRADELVNDADVEDECLQLYAAIERGFSDQYERVNQQLDYWDIYNCVLGPKQFYSGNSKIYIPLIADAIDARVTRFTNQIFPSTGKNVEVITSENKPQSLMSLLEFYIRKAKLRSQVIPALLRNGDVEGQYNLYINWVRNEHEVTWRVSKQEKFDPEKEANDEAHDQLAEHLGEEPSEIEIEGDEYDDIEEDTIVHEFPDVEVLADADVLVLPFTARSAQDALARGGSVTVLRRWSKSRIEQMIEDEELDADKGEELLEQFTSVKNPPGQKSKENKIIDSAGIKSGEGGETALVYETWTMLTIDGKRRIYRIRFGGEKLVLSCKRNPFWCDKVPLITKASKPVQGSLKGASRLTKLETMQYAANDAINEAMDSAHYSLLPIVMTDPVKNPRTTSMVLNVAAIWETSPQDTQFAKFPELWKDGFEIVAQFKGQIFQTLGVNPAMMPMMDMGNKTRKPNQAQVAQEQQVDILTTADVVTELEESVLTEILRWFVYLDHQYRTEEMTIPQFGVEGKHLMMDTVLPMQMDRRFEVKWFGVEAARSAQQMQQQMAGINVVRGLPPQLYPGFELNLTPVIQQFLENLFGPRIAAQVFIDARKKLSMEADFENRLLSDMFSVPVSVLDDDQKHLQSHMQAMQKDPKGDPNGVYREHIMRHQMQMQKKQQAAMAQQQQMLAGPQGPPGGGGPGGPGGPGAPRQGARQNGPRGGQGPAGMIHADQLRDAGAMPRR